MGAASWARWTVRVADFFARQCFSVVCGNSSTMVPTRVVPERWRPRTAAAGCGSADQRSDLREGLLEAGQIRAERLRWLRPSAVGVGQCGGGAVEEDRQAQLVLDAHGRDDVEIVLGLGGRTDDVTAAGCLR